MEFVLTVADTLDTTRRHNLPSHAMAVREATLEPSECNRGPVVIPTTPEISMEDDMRRLLNSKIRHGGLAILATTVLTVASATGAQAELLAAGALFGGASQRLAVCYVYNSGSSNLGLTGFRITTPDGVPLSLARNECGATLLPGRSCGVAANVGNITSYNCRVDVSSKASARGVFEMRTSTGASLTNVELR